MCSAISGTADGTVDRTEGVEFEGHWRVKLKLKGIVRSLHNMTLRGTSIQEDKDEMVDVQEAYAHNVLLLLLFVECTNAWKACLMAQQLA